MTDVINDLTNNQDSTATGANGQSVLETLVGEGRKFKTPEDLAKSALEKDRYISQLTREAKELREQLGTLEQKTSRQTTLEEVLNAINSSKTNGEGNQPGASVEDITRIVDSRVREQEMERARKANRDAANARLLSLVGNDSTKAADLLRTVSREKGLSLIEIKELSERSPLAFEALLGPQNTGGDKGNQGTPNNERRDSNLNGVVRNSSWYLAKMKEMGLSKYYADFSLLNQRDRDMAELGDKFFA